MSIKSNMQPPMICDGHSPRDGPVSEQQVTDGENVVLARHVEPPHRLSHMRGVNQVASEFAGVHEPSSSCEVADLIVRHDGLLRDVEMPDAVDGGEREQHERGGERDRGAGVHVAAKRSGHAAMLAQANFRA